MGVVIKQSSIAVVFTYLGAIIGAVNTIVLFPYFLSPEQIGLYKLLPNVALLIMPAAQLGLGQVLQKFAPELKQNKNGLTQLISCCIILACVGFVLSAAILFVFQDFFASFYLDTSPLFVEYFFVAIILVLLFSIQTIYEIYSRLFLKIVFQTIIKELLIRVMISLSVTMYFFQLISFHQLTVGLIVIFSIALLLLIGYVYVLGELKFTFRFHHLDKHLPRMGHYALYVIIGVSSTGIVLNIDQLMVTSYLSLDANGIYSTVFYFAVMIELPIRAIGQITSPLIAESLEKQKIVEVGKIYQQTSINQMVIGSLFFIELVCNLDQLFSLMANGERYATGRYVVYFMGAAKVVNMAFANGSAIISLSKYYRFNVVTIAWLAVMMVAFNIVLIPKFGISGAAFASMSALIIFAVIKMIFIKMKFGLVPFTSKSLHLLCIAMITLAVGMAIPLLANVWLDMFIRSTVIVLLFSTCVYFFEISNEINRIVRLLLKKWQ